MRGFCLSSSFPEKGVGWLEIPKPQIQNPYDAILEPVAVSPCTSDVHSARANMAGGNAASNLILGKTGQKRRTSSLDTRRWAASWRLGRW